MVRVERSQSSYGKEKEQQPVMVTFNTVRGRSDDGSIGVEIVCLHILFMVDKCFNMSTIKMK